MIENGVIKPVIASCDCCGKTTRLYFVNPERAFGIDTYACPECQGLEPEEDDDEDGTLHGKGTRSERTP